MRVKQRRVAKPTPTKAAKPAPRLRTASKIASTVAFTTTTKPLTVLDGEGARKRTPLSPAQANTIFATVGMEIVEGRARPPDVEAARNAFDPSIYSATQKKWAGLIAEAMKQLGGPRVMVNRPAESALRLLQNGGRFTTIFDRKKTNADVDAYLETRLVHEQRLNTHGVGEQAGKTVYGSVEFSQTRSAAPHEDAILKSVKKGVTPKRPHLNTGIALTDGAVTFVMKQQANEQSTYLPGDTYIDWATPPRALEHLAYAVLENMLTQGDTYFDGLNGSDALFELPREQAIAGIKQYLTSEALQRDYLEAQVRAPTLDDVGYVVLRDDPNSNRPTYDGRTIDEVLADVKRAAEARGITIIDERTFAQK